MSRKWQQAKRWDDEHLSGPALRPVKWVLRSLSSIWLAVILLVLVSLYGVLASVPIGLLALAPTWGVYSLSVVIPVALAAILVFLGARGLIPSSRPALRMVAGLAGAIAAGVGVSWLWGLFVWPILHYDPVDETGLRFFASFVSAKEAVTLRRLPGFEMSELEFYSWWPLRIILLLFVVNMIVATVRRIEFTFKNIGVLAVHTGIVIISLGSVYYQGLKKEGDTIVFAARPAQPGATPEDAGVGPMQTGFYDNTRVALWVAQRRAWTGTPDWEQRPLSGVPRYNDYNLDAAGGGDAPLLSRVINGEGNPGTADNGSDRDLALTVPDGPGNRIDADISFRVVGYAGYAEGREDWRKAAAPSSSSGIEPHPVRIVELLSRLSAADEEAGGVPVIRAPLHPKDPTHRIAENEAFVLEHEIDPDPRRVGDLLTRVPPRTAHALIVEVPNEPGSADGARSVMAAEAGNEYVIGETGWRVGVKELLPEPPFPIITAGYEGATSPVAVLQVTPPEGDAYERYVYDRFPAINQDILGTQEDGRPNRRDADPAIRISYLDLTRLRVLLNESSETGLIQAIVREPGGGLKVLAPAPPGEVMRDIVPKIDLRVADAWAHAERIELPISVPDKDRERRFIGTHDMAMIAVEVSVPMAETGADWSRVVWLPFARYLETAADQHRTLTLPGGRELTMAFGRIRHGFPGFGIRLADFEMIAYDHRGAPRDYQSVLRVVPAVGPGVRAPIEEPYERVAKLNAPLRAPFVWSEERGWLSNAAIRMTSGLNPHQFKLSQAGWDQQGWQETQQLADQGVLPRPFARFTILQVGNNPGIHVIAFGGVLMGVGIPWAFYVKPWLVRREKTRLATQHAGRAKGGLGKPARDDASPATPVPSAVEQETVQA